MSLTIYLEIGHEASLRSKTTPEGFTHDWEVYVRGCNGADISHYVDKVMFHLHETFPKPKRVIKEPPYLLKMSGYAGFVLPIDVYLKNSGGEPRKIRFNYDLQLQPNGPKIVRSQREKYTFGNVSEEFRSKLIKGGAQIGGYESESVKSSNSFADDRNLISKPKLSSGGSDFKKMKPREEPDSFQNLFGPPIKKFNAKEPPPPPPPVVNKEKSEKKVERSSGSNKKSPHKEPPPPQREKSEKSEKKKDKEEKSKKDKPKEHKENRQSSNQKSSSSVSSNLAPPVAPMEKKGRSPTPSKIKDKERDRDKEKERERDKEKQKDDKKKQRHSHKENKHNKESSDSKKAEKLEKLEKIEKGDTKPPKDKVPEVKKDREKDKEERKHKHKKKDKDRKDKPEKTAEKLYKSSDKLEKSDKKSAALFGSPKSDIVPPIVDDKQQSISNKRQKPLSNLMTSLIDENSSNSSKSSRASSPAISEPQLPPPPPILPPPPPKSEKKKEKKERKKEKKSDKEHDRKRKRKEVAEMDSGDEEVSPVKKEKIEEEDEDERKVSSSEDANVPTKKETNGTTVKNETEDYMGTLRELQHKIMGLRENADLQRVVALIVETGRYEVSAHTFDFDLCLLDRSTVRQLQDFFAQIS